MTNIFIETGSLTSNEYNFVKMFIEQCSNKRIQDDYVLVRVGGKDKLEQNKSKFFDHQNDQEKNLVIFDADMPENGGGFEKRKKDLTDKLKSMGVQFELSLFPNDKDDGMFEHLLERIINPEHKHVLECFTCYEKCLEKYRQSDGSSFYQMPDQKAKMYAYISSFKRNNAAKEEIKNKGFWDFENPEYWNMQAEYLKPLIAFLQKNV